MAFRRHAHITEIYIHTDVHRKQTHTRTINIVVYYNTIRVQCYIIIIRQCLDAAADDDTSRK